MRINHERSRTARHIRRRRDLPLRSHPPRLARARGGCRRRRRPARTTRRPRARHAQARRHLACRHRRQAREHGPGLRAALLVAADLPARLQQAGLRRRGRPVHPGAREVVEAGERQDVALRARRQRRLPQRRAVHRPGRRLHVHAAAGCEEQAADAHLLLAGGGGRGGRAVSGALSPRETVRATARDAHPGDGDREREGAEGEGSEARSDRNRALSVRRVGQGRSRHARALGQVLPAGASLHRSHHLPCARRRHSATDRTADRPIQLDPDRAAAADSRARARSRPQGLARPTLSALLPDAQREQAAIQRPGLRQAIAWAIDRAEIVKLVYFGSHVPTAEPTPETSPWATGVNAHKGGPDVARAKQLLSEAGAGGGLTLTYLVKSQVPVLVKTGEILREQFKKVGITLDVQPMESGQYFESLVGKKFDIAGAWWSVTVDPDMFYSPLQHSTSPWNFSGFKSEEADRRIDAFRFTTNPAARKKMYPDLVRWFQEEGSLIVFSNEIQRYWMKPNVYGSVPLPSLELRFEESWIG